MLCVQVPLEATLVFSDTSMLILYKMKEISDLCYLANLRCNINNPVPFLPPNEDRNNLDFPELHKASNVGRSGIFAFQLNYHVIILTYNR